MRYIPVIITQANLHWAFNENVRRIEAVLRTKLQTNRSLPMPDVDADNNQIVNAVSQEDTDACTVATYLELRND